MSKLDELIEELCPDGVEYRELWSITTWDKRFNSVEREKQPHVILYPYLLAARLFKLEQTQGDVFLLSTGEKTGWTTEEMAADYLCDGEVVSIPWGKSRPVKEVLKYYKGKFVTADNRIATSNDTTKLLNRYLYYWMLSSSEAIDGFYRGSGIKHPSMNDVLHLVIPLPPLPVQEEIVRILDNFTELTARKKQYEYYRDSLLTFGDEVEWKLLGELTRIFSASRVHRNEWTQSGVPFYRSSDVIALFYGVENSRGQAFITHERYEILSAKSGKFQKGDILITGGGTIGIPYIIPNNEPLYVKDADLLCIKKSMTLNSKFLFHYFLSSKFRSYLSDITHNATIAHYTISQVAKTPIPVPSLTEQQRIVDILDRFDTLCNDISSGLPAEIKARQQQYEYYRDKLLTFKEKEA